MTMNDLVLDLDKFTDEGAVYKFREFLERLSKSVQSKDDIQMLDDEGFFAVISNLEAMDFFGTEGLNF